MRVLVCIKQVPNVANLRIDPVTKRLLREGVPLEVNSFDVRAVHFAVQLRNAGQASEVVVVTLGPPPARAALEYCLALGADRAVHLCDSAFAGSDVLATARALAGIVRAIQPGLVLCGRYSVDAETAQLGPELATLLGFPCLAQAQRITEDPGSSGHFLVECETDDGVLRVRAATPFLATTTEGIAPEVFPSQADLEAARSKPVRTLSAAEAGIDPREVGNDGSPTRVEDLVELPVQRLQRKLDEGVLEDQVRELARTLVAEYGLFGDWKIEPTRSLAPLPEKAPCQTSGRILVVADSYARGGPRVTREILGRAGQLARALRGSVGLVLTASRDDEGSEWSRYGVDQLFLVRSEKQSVWPWELVRIVSSLIESWQPEIVLFPSTWFGRSVAAGVAADKGLGLSADCIDLGLDENGRLLQFKPAFGGTIAAVITCRTLPAMATVRPGVFPVPDTAPVRSCAVSPIAVSSTASSVEIVASQEIPDSGSALDEADIVVGVGMGVVPDGLPLLREFAGYLGAPLCTTRDVVDAGWLPRHLQVGLTGRSIAPKLYVAVGIRGAFEHVVGFRRAGLVVAINRNPRALIFRHADFGIVGDYRTAIPLLKAALEEARVEHGR